MKMILTIGLFLVSASANADAVQVADNFQPEPVQTHVFKRSESEAIVQQHVDVAVAGKAISDAPRGMTAVSVKILRNGMQEVERNVLIRDGDSAAISERYGFAIAIMDGKINPDDLSGFWQLTISKITFGDNGASTIEAKLDAREARQEATSQKATVNIKAGEKSGLIHGANGKDYLLSVRHIDSQI